MNSHPVLQELTMAKLPKLFTLQFSDWSKYRLRSYVAAEEEDFSGRELYNKSTYTCAQSKNLQPGIHCYCFILLYL